MTSIIVGPVFEVTLGECSSHPALESYHIEFLGGRLHCPDCDQVRESLNVESVDGRSLLNCVIDYGIGMDMYHAVYAFREQAPNVEQATLHRI